MCIRDRYSLVLEVEVSKLLKTARCRKPEISVYVEGSRNTCLLYTSDAADERSSVDLGGRRIIKKKNKKKLCERSVM